MIGDFFSWFWNLQVGSGFPQEYSSGFYYAKGVLGVVATICLVVYMNKAWDKFKTRGQKLRFLTLLYFVALVTAASAEQIQQGAEVNLRNIGAMGGILFMFYTLWVSVNEDLLHRKK